MRQKFNVPGSQVTERYIFSARKRKYYLSAKNDHYGGEMFTPKKSFIIYIYIYNVFFFSKSGFIMELKNPEPAESTTKCLWIVVTKLLHTCDKKKHKVFHTFDKKIRILGNWGGRASSKRLRYLFDLSKMLLSQPLL